MILYIDTEFNGYEGALISMALVDMYGAEWYEVLIGPGHEFDTWFDPWVARHVLPVLNKPSVSRAVAQHSLQKFLTQYPTVHLVADWPDDIKHFCELLLTGPGERIDTPPLTMEIRRDIGSDKSAIPHNALEDAKALRLAAHAGRNY